ncbi:MAG: Ribosomal silencing factor RsfS [Syntrophaceae bacterium PtaB.Bin038]|nr:MAG: Ribosomal silencing factor RsfS [Syntrophaceae bacterium PtaB.Bin038]
MAKKDLSTRQKILLAVNAALEKKAKNIVILNIKNVTSFADYTVICSGTSDRQVQSIASAIEEGMKKAGALPLGIEGEKGGRWVLMDYADIVVHVFFEPVREFYDIERLWSDAPKMEVAEDAGEIKSLPRGM